MKILVVMPSKSLNDPLIVEGKNYLARMRSQISASSLMLAPKSSIAEEHRDKRILLEGAELLQKTTGYLRIGLADTGKEFTSTKLADFLRDQLPVTKKIAFIIGGAFGLSSEVLKLCHLTLSLSRMTMPHKMAFLVLSEQLYRADEIIRGTPYHK